MSDLMWVVYLFLFVLIIGGHFHILRKKIWGIQAELWALTRTVRGMERRLRDLGLDDTDEGEE